MPVRVSIVAVTVAGCTSWKDAVTTAVRETAEESGMQVTVTGIVGLFTDPGVVVRSPTGQVRQQFAVIVRASAENGVPRGDLQETSEAAWVPRARLPRLRMEPHVQTLTSKINDCLRRAHLAAGELGCTRTAAEASIK